MLRKRIDHVMFTPSHFHATHCEVLQGYEGNASDHLPVVVDFRMKQDKEDDQVMAAAPTYLFSTLTVQ